MQVPFFIKAMVDKAFDASSACITDSIWLDWLEEMEEAPWEERMGDDGLRSGTVLVEMKVACLCFACISRVESQFPTTIADVWCLLLL